MEIQPLLKVLETLRIKEWGQLYFLHIILVLNFHFRPCAMYERYTEKGYSKKLMS